MTLREALAPAAESVPGEPRHRAVVDLDERDARPRQGQRPAVNSVAKDDVERVFAMAPKEAPRGAEGPRRLLEAERTTESSVPGLQTRIGENLDVPKRLLDPLIEDLDATGLIRRDELREDCEAGVVDDSWPVAEI